MAISAGVSDADARDIAAWAPTHESLLADSEESLGIYFHPLPSGAYAIGRAMPIRRPGGHPGARWASTHCLIARPRIVARFAGNPFALLRAVDAAGVPHRYDELPAHLDAIPVDGRAAIVDTALLSQLALAPGPEWMAALVQTAIDASRLAIIDGRQPEEIVAGILNCLPPECRVRMTFSIGLRFCGRRPYRLVALPSGAEEGSRIRRLYNITVLDLADKPPSPVAPVGSWGSLVQRVLRSERVPFFAGQLARRPLDFTACDLPALGLQMLEELDASATMGEENETHVPDSEPGADAPWDADRSGVDDLHAGWSPEPELKSPSHGRSRRAAHHAAHSSGPPRANPPAEPAVRPTPPSRQLDPSDPAVLARLERLDDLVFDSIAGDAEALEELRVFWPKVRNELGDPVLAESREQYLRYALASWERLAQHGDVRDPTFAMQSPEVLHVLFGGKAD